MINYAVFMDGASWCAVRPDYINLQESLAGFGNTPELAKIHLLEQELLSACEERDRYKADVANLKEQLAAWEASVWMEPRQLQVDSYSTGQENVYCYIRDNQVHLDLTDGASTW